MNIKKKLIASIGAAVIIITLFSGCVSQTNQGGSTSPIGTAPPEVIQYASDWPLPNKDYANTRSTTDSSINSGNVNNLGVVWAGSIAGWYTFWCSCMYPQL
jgi:PBP1b-binding outer membrane lipoprotein LpoB